MKTKLMFTFFCSLLLSTSIVFAGAAPVVELEVKAKKNSKQNSKQKTETKTQPVVAKPVPNKSKVPSPTPTPSVKTETARKSSAVPVQKKEVQSETKKPAKMES